MQMTAYKVALLSRSFNKTKNARVNEYLRLLIFVSCDPVCTKTVAAFANKSRNLFTLDKLSNTSVSIVGQNIVHSEFGFVSQNKSSPLWIYKVYSLQFAGGFKVMQSRHYHNFMQFEAVEHCKGLLDQEITAPTFSLQNAANESSGNSFLRKHEL